MKLLNVITDKDKEKCEYLFKALERLTESNRYVNPPPDIQVVTNIYASGMLFVYGEESVEEETLFNFIKSSIDKMEDKSMAWCVERLLFDAT